MIRLRDLTKKFGEKLAVDRLTLHVKQGELFGFLGPNGAGKTTTIRLMTGLLKPTEGTVIIGGKDIVREALEAKRLFSLIPDTPFLYEKLTGLEFLRFIGDLYDLNRREMESRIEALFELFELAPWANELIEGYSHGMKQKLVMSAALLHRPQLLIVDEPMVGLDPKSARMVKEIFRGFCQNGGTVFLSTHTLELAQELCDRIAIIQQGRIIALGTMDELRERARSDDGRLETIFLKLTGGEGTQGILKILKS